MMKIMPQHNTPTLTFPPADHPTLLEIPVKDGTVKVMKDGTVQAPNLDCMDEATLKFWHCMATNFDVLGE